ncbi:DNA repair protein [Mycena amicta]|nr:DNA repair protein [Mycena amicta]
MYAPFSAEKQGAHQAAIQFELDVLQKQLAQLGADLDADAIVKHHIKLLHKYNEAKDATQILIGKLATLKETTIRKIHEDYNLRGED